VPSHTASSLFGSLSPCPQPTGCGLSPNVHTVGRNVTQSRVGALEPSDRKPLQVHANKFGTPGAHTYGNKQSSSTQTSLEVTQHLVKPLY